MALIKLLSTDATIEARGIKKSQHYEDIAEGLYTKPVKQGRRSLWPENEINALNRARVAGKSDEEMRELVRQLEAARTSQTGGAA